MWSANSKDFKIKEDNDKIVHVETIRVMIE